MKSGKVNMKDSLVVSYKIKHISYHKEHCAPCYLPELKTYVQTKTHIWIFIAALLINTKT